MAVTAKRTFDAETAKRLSLKKKKLELRDEELDFIDLVQLSPLFSRLAESDGVITVMQLDTLTGALLQDFHERRHEILAALDKLLPQKGINQAMTVMRLCYQLSRGKNINSEISNRVRPDSPNFVLLALLFNASEDGRHQDALSLGEILLERFPECPELLVEMSIILDRLKDKKSSISFKKKQLNYNRETLLYFADLSTSSVNAK